MLAVHPGYVIQSAGGKRERRKLADLLPTRREFAWIVGGAVGVVTASTGGVLGAYKLTEPDTTFPKRGIAKALGSAQLKFLRLLRGSLCAPGVDLTEALAQNSLVNSTHSQVIADALSPFENVRRAAEQTGFRIAAVEPLVETAFRKPGPVDAWHDINEFIQANFHLDYHWAISTPPTWADVRTLMTTAIAYSTMPLELFDAVAEHASKKQRRFMVRRSTTEECGDVTYGCTSPGWLFGDGHTDVTFNADAGIWDSAAVDTSLHEFGHIVHFSLLGAADDLQHQMDDLRPLDYKDFDAQNRRFCEYPDAYATPYASTNSREEWAENFLYIFGLDLYGIANFDQRELTDVCSIRVAKFIEFASALGDAVRRHSGNARLTDFLLRSSYGNSSLTARKNVDNSGSASPLAEQIMTHLTSPSYGAFDKVSPRVSIHSPGPARPDDLVTFRFADASNYPFGVTYEDSNGLVHEANPSVTLSPGRDQYEFTLDFGPSGKIEFIVHFENGTPSKIVENDLENGRTYERVAPREDFAPGRSEACVGQEL